MTRGGATVFLLLVLRGGGGRISLSVLRGGGVFFLSVLGGKGCFANFFPNLYLEVLLLYFMGGTIQRNTVTLDPTINPNPEPTGIAK